MQFRADRKDGEKQNDGAEEDGRSRFPAFFIFHKGAHVSRDSKQINILALLRQALSANEPPYELGAKCSATSVRYAFNAGTIPANAPSAINCRRRPNHHQIKLARVQHHPRLIANDARQPRP